MNRETLTELKLWLDTLSPPQSMRGNEAAMKAELGILSDTLTRAGADTPGRVRAVFTEVKRRAQTRSWPTPREIIDAASGLRSDQGGRDTGDMDALTHDERLLLEAKVLPAARRFLDIPGLREHGQQTLAYWGQQ